MVFEEVLRVDRKLGLLARALRADAGFRPDLAELLTGYLDAYCAYHRLGAADVARCYQGFIEAYLEDLEAYRRDGRYPFERGETRLFARTDYDIALMLSYLLSAHRFRILCLVAEWAMPNPALVVGCGAGSEIEVLRRVANCQHVVAFDTEVSPFCASRHEGVEFREQAFAGTDERFGQAIAVELLEHVPDPFGLLKSLLQAAEGGRTIVTTAHNLPQFDHIYNFGEFEVEDWLDARGYRPLVSEKIVHTALGANTDTYNKFYVVDSRS